MTDNTSKNIATFPTRKEASSIVDDLNSRPYHLAHGEYERPDYTVRKVRGKDCFYIYARRYYYPETFHTRESGGLEWNSNELCSHP